MGGARLHVPHHAALVAVWRLMILSMEEKVPDMFKGSEYPEIFDPDPKDGE